MQIMRRLSDLIFERKKSLSEFPYPVRKVYSQKDANSLTRSIEDFCNYVVPTCYAARVNTMGIFDTRKQRFRPSGSTKGAADISICHEGRVIQCEVKFGKDRQSASQSVFEGNIKAAGGRYIIVRTFEDFLDKTEFWKYIKE